MDPGEPPWWAQWVAGHRRLGRAVHLLITGAVGSRTTTLASALAECWGAVAIEADAFYWLPPDPPFKSKRDPNQRLALLERQLHAH